MKVIEEHLETKTIGTVRLDERRRGTPPNTITPRYLDDYCARHGGFTIQLNQMRSVPIAPPVLASLVIQLNWGSLGARDQYGYGFVKPTQPNGFDINSLIPITAVAAHINGPIGNQHALEDFFYFKASASRTDDLTSSSTLEFRKIPFIIRHDTRNCVRTLSNTSVRHFFFGKINGQNRQGTRFNIGITIDNTLLGWGWFPRHGDHAAHRNACLDVLKAEVTRHATGSILWKEFNSTRDNCGSATTWSAFLTELLTSSWR